MLIPTDFVVPVILQPGAKYDFSLVRFNEKVADFRSTDGVAAAAYSWRFATRDAAANPKAPKPRVVSRRSAVGGSYGHDRFDSRPIRPAHESRGV